MDELGGLVLFQPYLRMQECMTDLSMFKRSGGIEWGFETRDLNLFTTQLNITTNVGIITTSDAYLVCPFTDFKLNASYLNFLVDSTASQVENMQYDGLTELVFCRNSNINRSQLDWSNSNNVDL